MNNHIDSKYVATKYFDHKYYQHKYKLAIFNAVEMALNQDYYNNLQNLKCRKRGLKEFRQICMKMLYEFTPMSTTEVAAEFNKDHSTCIHSIKTIRNLEEVEPRTRMLMDDLRDDILERFEKINDIDYIRERDDIAVKLISIVLQLLDYDDNHLTLNSHDHTTARPVQHPING